MRRAVIKTGKYLLRGLAHLQARHSAIPNDPILDNRIFPWTGDLEAQTQTMQAELARLLPNLAAIPSFHELSPDQARISKGANWKTYTFYVFGQRIEHNCEECPQTAAFLATLPGLQNAFFSILAPRYHIPAHRGPTKALVRCHLPLEVPRDASACWLRVDSQRVHWQTGRCLLFDDTYEHEVGNDTDDYRIVLFLDIERPMNRFGTLLNRALLGAIKLSAYARDPLRNAQQWRNQPHAR